MTRSTFVFERTEFHECKTTLSDSLFDLLVVLDHSITDLPSVKISSRLSRGSFESLLSNWNTVKIHKRLTYNVLV